MHTELEKMVAGELYDPADPVLVEMRRRAQELCCRLNATAAEDTQSLRVCWAGSRLQSWRMHSEGCAYWSLARRGEWERRS